MPLSKKRDKERKRHVRLEKDKIQPNIAIPGLLIEGNRVVGVASRLDKGNVQPNVDDVLQKALDYIKNNPPVMEEFIKRYQRGEVDGDGNPMPDYT